MLLFVYYSTALDNTDISISNKGKTSVFTNGIKTFNKETLDDKIRKLIIANTQLMIDKIEIKKAKVNLETNRARLFDEKNSLVVKKKKLRAEIVILNVTEPSNIPIRGH